MEIDGPKRLAIKETQNTKSAEKTEKSLCNSINRYK